MEVDNKHGIRAEITLAGLLNGGGPENDPRDTDSRARHKHAKHLDQTIATPAKHGFLRLTIWPLRFGKGYRIPTWRGTAIHYCLSDNVG
jgi:hypothetical protein